MRKYAVYVSACLLISGLVVLFFFQESFFQMLRPNSLSLKTVMGKIAQPAQNRLAPLFEAAGKIFPPEGITLIGIKDTKVVEAWVCYDKKWTYLTSYPILGISGNSGPKLREGDKQVPEGIYKIEGLNPNSRFHLSMKINYPNDFDLLHANEEGRNEPGGDIFIHGSDVSVGCLAMGNEAIEELFVLVAETGIENVQVILAPTDFRKHEIQIGDSLPTWCAGLYENIHDEMLKFSR